MGINDAIQGSFIGKFFQLEERKTDFTTELKGALATFLTMAYILAVNPAILSDSGGPCIPPDGNIFDPEYETCMFDVKKQYITATAIASMIGCFLMGFMANLPVALAPGVSNQNSVYAFVTSFCNSIKVLTW